MRMLKIFTFLIVVGALGLVGFAYFGNLTPEQGTVTIPVELNGQ